jgi:Bacterial regulatory helix-turn-helix proteins, AraC family
MGELAAGKLPLAEIALNAHFSSQASFTRAFHRVTGMTPKEYQRSHAIMPTLLASTGVRIAHLAEFFCTRLEAQLFERLPIGWSFALGAVYWLTPPPAVALWRLRPGRGQQRHPLKIMSGGQNRPAARARAAPMLAAALSTEASADAYLSPQRSRYRSPARPVARPARRRR